jgi:hypothetical protein
MEFSLSPDVTFAPREVIVGFRNVAWGFNSIGASFETAIKHSTMQLLTTCRKKSVKLSSKFLSK